MRSNCFVYLSGPITANGGYTVADNVASALAVFYACICAGIPAFCPQLGALDLAAFTIDYETWIAYDFAVIDRCTAVLMLPRWETSAGAVREARYAALRGLPVFYDIAALARHLGAVTDSTGRIVAPPQQEPAERPEGPWNRNAPTRD